MHCSGDVGAIRGGVVEEPRRLQEGREEAPHGRSIGAAALQRPRPRGISFIDNEQRGGALWMDAAVSPRREAEGCATPWRRARPQHRVTAVTKAISTWRGADPCAKFREGGDGFGFVPCK